MSHKEHPAAAIFPMMTEAAFRELKADIEKHGQREPVVFYKQQLLDGRNRWKACYELGIRPSECELDESEDPIAYVLSSNLHRRHLDEGQRSMIGGRVKDYHAKEAKSRQRLSKGRGQKGGANLPQVNSNGKARDKAAEAVNVSPRSVDHASTVLAKGSPELIAAVDAGEVAVSRAAEIAKEVPKAKQAAKAKEKPAKKNKTPFEQMQHWWRKADVAAQTRFRLWIDDQCS